MDSFKFLALLVGLLGPSYRDRVKQDCYLAGLLVPLYSMVMPLTLLFDLYSLLDALQRAFTVSLLKRLVALLLYLTN